MSRLAKLLMFAKKFGGGGGNVEPLVVTENGEYNAKENIDGYAPVIIAVPKSDVTDPADAAKALIDNFGSAEYCFARKLNEEDLLKCLRYDITENATSVAYMFHGCNNLQTLPVLNLSKVKSARGSAVGGVDYMFQNCTALKEVPPLNILHLENIRYTFDYCLNLEFPDWITEYEGIFFGTFKFCNFINGLKNKTFKCKEAANLFMNGLYNIDVENVHFPFSQSCNSIFRETYAAKFSNITIGGDCSYAFYKTNATEISNLNITNLSSNARISSLFGYCKKLTTVTISKIETIDNSMFGLTSIFEYCDALVDAPYIDLKNCNYFHYVFQACKALKTIPAYDFRNVTNLGGFVVNCTSLEEINVKNISANLEIGNGTKYGTNITTESLIHVIYECRINTGSALKVSSASLQKLASIYVKLVPVTDEMRAEDDLVDEKLPFVVCESTDEGAMLITDYAAEKNWSVW